jgi:Mrp family chromosome partitioning ATPase
MLSACPGHLDTWLIVIEEGKTQSPDLAEAIDRVKGSNILGTVLDNLVKVTVSKLILTIIVKMQQYFNCI